MPILVEQLQDVLNESKSYDYTTQAFTARSAARRNHALFPCAVLDIGPFSGRHGMDLCEGPRISGCV